MLAAALLGNHLEMIPPLVSIGADINGLHEPACLDAAMRLLSSHLPDAPPKEDVTTLAAAAVLRGVLRGHPLFLEPESSDERSILKFILDVLRCNSVDVGAQEMPHQALMHLTPI